MRLTLIKPNIGRREHSLYVDEARMEPLPLGILAALTPEDVEVVLYDDRMETIPYDTPTDLVGITVETFTARRAYEISAEYMARGVKVIMGGMHAKLIPEEVAQHCDCVIVGDAEPVWAKMIADFRAGCLQRRYDAVQPLCPQTGIIARRDIFEGKITAVRSRRCSGRYVPRNESSSSLSMTTSSATGRRQRNCSGR